MSNAPTTKIENHIEIGLTCNYLGDYHAHASEIDYADNGDRYIITYHAGYMPPFDQKTFSTLQELANEMKSICDLRKWTITRHD